MDHQKHSHDHGRAKRSISDLPKSVSWVTTPPLKHIRPAEASTKDSVKTSATHLSDSSPNGFLNEPTPLVLKRVKLGHDHFHPKKHHASNSLGSEDIIDASQESRNIFFQILNSIQSSNTPQHDKPSKKPLSSNPSNIRLKSNAIKKTNNPPSTNEKEEKTSLLDISLDQRLKLGGVDTAPDPRLKQKGQALNHIRLLVLEIIQVDEVNSILKVLDEKSEKIFRVTLDSEWSDVVLNSGIYINIIFQDPLKLQHFILASKDNQVFQLSRNELVIIDPDELVSITTVADSFHCLRRSIIKDRIRLRGSLDQSIVHGNIIHELFQSAMEENNFTKEWLVSKLLGIISENVECLYGINQSETECLKLLTPSIDQIILWRDQNYLTSNVSSSSNHPRIVKALDIEERIWSSKYGLKGNIDVTVKIKFPGSSGFSIAPLELKTGNATSISHNAQTLMYTLTLSDRHNTKVDNGLLIYLKKGQSITVTSSQGEQVGLLKNRNKLVNYLSAPELPPMLMNSYNCGKCFSKQECMVYHKVIENGTSSSSGVAAIFDEETDFITLQHMEFMKTWETAIRLEESRYSRNTRSLWTVSFEMRESEGTCISGLIIKSIKELQKSQSRFRYQYTLNRISFNTELSSQSSNETVDFRDSHFIEGDPIIITEQGSAHPLGIGFLYKIGSRTLQISTDKPIHHVSKVTNFNSFQKPETDPVHKTSKIFTIDKDGYASGLGGIRGNLYELFRMTGFRKRKLIVDLEAPTFERNHDKAIMSKVSEGLNEDQLNALVKVDSCNDYALILGMPGTGKTTVIARMIKLLVLKGKSVLLTSFTHSAVDNVLIKLHEIGVEFVRLGAIEKMHPIIKDIALKEKIDLNTTAKIEHYYGSAKVIATTALGISHPLFSRKCFDYCIVDESSQIALPVCLGPLQYAEKFVLVGDHYQLPPLFAQSENQSETLSLFKHLCQAHPEAVSTLKIQYRMNKDIMLLSNYLIYDYRLKSGSSKIHSSRLDLKRNESWINGIHTWSTLDKSNTCSNNSSCWINRVLDPAHSVLFLDTDQVPAIETKMGPWIENPIEALLVSRIVSAFIACGIDENLIGVISPYRHQLKKLSSFLDVFPKVEVSTVDKYQGRDKKCIIMSLTRSNNNQQTGDLLKDWQRLNVAITRAKQKLILVGSRKTLLGSQSFQNLFEIIDLNNWGFLLPKDAHILHQLPELPSTPLSKHPTTFGRPPLRNGKTSSELF